MIRLLALRTFIPVWARAISLSSKLSGKMWKFLTAVQCFIFILSAGGLSESRIPRPASSDVTITRVSPQVDSAQLLTPDLKCLLDAAALSRPAKRRTLAAAVRRQSTPGVVTLLAAVAVSRWTPLPRAYARRSPRPLLVTSYVRSPEAQARTAFVGLTEYHFAGALSFSGADVFARSVPAAYRANDTGHDGGLRGAFRGLGRLVEPVRAVGVQLSQPEGDDYKKALLFWASLLGLIVSPVSAASTAVVAWISVHRGRADALLKELQIEKMRLETEQLRAELEQARLEDAQRRPHIVIAAG